jgi:prophage maintenance system killer protein
MKDKMGSEGGVGRKSFGGEIVVYEEGGRRVELPFDEGDETIWATQAQMAEIFGVTPQSITIHLKKIYESRELDEGGTCKESLHVRVEGGREVTRRVRVYNLDAIISVGYRVNSRRATGFRMWATKVLRGYIVDGVAVNEGRIGQLDGEKLRRVMGMMGVVRRLVERNELGEGEASGVLYVISKYAESWEILEKYDEGRIRFGGGGRKARWVLTYDYCLEVIARMREDLGAGELFGKVRGGGLAAILGALYQTHGGRELYGSVVEKAANLLYLVIKDHPFYDGNKRIGAFLFIVFLTMNGVHLTEDGECRINDRALVAIALLIAESRAGERELIVALVGRLLGR